MPSFWSPDTRFRTIAWIVGIVLTVVLVGVSARWLGGAPPPNKIVLATGQPGGIYDGFGREYEKRLRAQGLKVELVNTAGSVDNLRRIVEGKVDVAFAQSGTYQVVTDPEHKVSGLAAIYYEPLWIFSRHGIRPSPRPSSRRRATTSPRRPLSTSPPPTRGESSSPASSTSPSSSPRTETPGSWT